MKIYRYDLLQNGIVVASVEAATDREAYREIGHYAFIYSADGPVIIKKRGGKKK